MGEIGKNIDNETKDKNWNKKSLKYDDKYYAEDEWEKVELICTCEKDGKQKIAKVTNELAIGSKEQKRKTEKMLERLLETEYGKKYGLSQAEEEDKDERWIW